MLRGWWSEAGIASDPPPIHLLNIFRSGFTDGRETLGTIHSQLCPSLPFMHSAIINVYSVVKGVSLAILITWRFHTTCKSQHVTNKQTNYAKSQYSCGRQWHWQLQFCEEPCFGFTCSYCSFVLRPNWLAQCIIRSSYPGGTVFECRLGHWLSWHGFKNFT
jgi:hypothetical protein